MRWSPSNPGWYPNHTDYPDIEDFVDVPDELYFQLLGKPVETGPDGLPRELVQAPPAHAELVATAIIQIRQERQPIISILDGMQTSALVSGDMATAQAIETAKQSLRDLTAIDLSQCETLEEMRLAVKAAYAQIVAQAPASVRIAFAEAVS